MKIVTSLQKISIENSYKLPKIPTRNNLKRSKTFTRNNYQNCLPNFTFFIEAISVALENFFQDLQK
jgi:hypothetical protein